MKTTKPTSRGKHRQPTILRRRWAKIVASALIVTAALTGASSTAEAHHVAAPTGIGVTWTN